MMKSIPRISLLNLVPGFLSGLLILAAATTTLAEDKAAKDELPTIFNGKDLTGWTVEPADQKDAWTIEEGGVLKLKNLPDKKGSTLWTDEQYTDFVMTFDFKLGEGTVDTGVYVRDSGQQIQIGESGSLKRDMTGSPYIAGKGYPKEAEGVKELLKLDDWNTMKIDATGNVYTVWLNGKKVVTYESDNAKEKGRVGIQLHGSRDMSAYYRDIRLQAK